MTYHCSLKWLHQIKYPNGRLALLMGFKLTVFDFTIVYRTGVIHQNSEGLLNTISSNAQIKDGLF